MCRGRAGSVSASAGAVFALLLSSSLKGHLAFSVLPSCIRPAVAAATCEADPSQRREFLLNSIGSIVGSVQSTRSLTTMSVEVRSPLRVCVVGAGSISREFALYHFGTATQTIVTSVVDLDESRARSLAVDVGSVQAGASIQSQGKGGAYSAAATETRGKPVQFATSLAPCLEGCDLVYIGTTPKSHAKLVIESLDAGKSVLLEKPLAATPADADAIVAAAEQAELRGQILGMDIGMRWNPALHELRRLAVTERELGELKSARLTLAFKKWPREWQVQPWVAGRSEGGPLREVGTHFFFSLMELFGQRCVGRVRADVLYSDGPRGSGAEVSASGTLQLGSEAGSSQGLSIALDVRTDAERRDVYELEVVGERGSLMLVDFSRLKRTAPAQQWLVQPGSYGRVESVRTLVDVVRGGGNKERAGGGLITARQGRNAQRVLDAVLASGGEWLDITYD